MTKKEKQVEDDIVKQLRLEVRRALRERKLVRSSLTRGTGYMVRGCT